MGWIRTDGYEDMGGVIFPVEELLMARHFTTEGLGTIAFLDALVGSVEGWLRTGLK